MLGWRSAFRWVEVSFTLPTSFFRLPRLFSSYITPRWSPQSLSGFAPEDIRRWLLDLDYSIVDTVLWPVVTAFESVALVSMLCFFFVFCGCTI